MRAVVREGPEQPVRPTHETVPSLSRQAPGGGVSGGVAEQRDGCRHVRPRERRRLLLLGSRQLHARGVEVGCGLWCAAYMYMSMYSCISCMPPMWTAHGGGPGQPRAQVSGEVYDLEAEEEGGVED